MTKHIRRQHGSRPRSDDGDSSEEDEGYEPQGQPGRMRHSSASTVPSQDLNMHYGKRVHPVHHHPHHLSVNSGVSRHPQAVYLSPNPSSAGPQAPPIYYSAPPSAYPHTPNSMVHRDGDEEYDSNTSDGMAGEPNPYHRMQMQQPKYPQGYHGSAGAFHPNDPVAYYSPSLPTPAVSPPSTSNLPPPGQYSQGPSGHHSPPSGAGSANPTQHQPTPYQAHHPPNPAHPQPIHYAAAYSGHRMYALGGEVDGVPRLHASHYPSSQNMPMGEGSHGLGIAMGQPMKVEVSTPMGTAW